MRVFSPTRIWFYFILFYFLSFSYVTVDYCYCYQILPTPISDIFQFCIISARRFFKGSCLLLTIYLYCRVTKQLKQEIVAEEKLLVSVYSEMMESEEYSVEWSLDTFVSHPYHLREEKQYFGAVRLFVLVFMPILSLRYFVELFINFHALGSGKLTLNLSEQFTLKFLFVLQNTLYILSSLLFYRTTEDFKKRFRRPFGNWGENKNVFRQLSQTTIN